VASLITELLHDAAQRADEIATELESFNTVGSPEVNAYGSRMAAMARQAQRLVEGLLADPDIDDPKYATNYFREYGHFARLLRLLEDLPLLVLKRFSPADQQATELMAAICREAGYPFQAPICSAISSQYFWTTPDMDLVFVPCLEPEHILGLPDLYHELGHILLFREKTRLEFPALAIVDRHYDRLLAEGRKLNWPPASLSQVEAFQHKWRRSWLLEFGSDLIATFLVGPAFGWCNIRTATNLGGELFVGNDSHPADDARATAIGMMLTEIGFDESREQIQSRWNELITLADESAPHRYELAYPGGLLRDLTEFYLEECQSIGLQAFNSSERSRMAVASAIDECWSEFRNKPQSYGEFERKKLETLLVTIRSV
jgi:hypothetical protein